MTHWVPRQNKLEIPNDEEEKNRNPHQGAANHGLTSREDVALKKWPKAWLCCANGILNSHAVVLRTTLLWC
jgi:hypothetical protein